MVSFRLKKTLTLIVCACLVLNASAFAAGKKPNTVVSGVVRAANSDPKGNVISIEILVGESEEEPYLVANNAKGQELRKHIGEYVIAGGVVSEDALGWKTIEVIKYQFADEH